MKEITPQEYRAIADELILAIGGRELFDGCVESGEYSLRATLIVSRNENGTIANITPVWWELRWEGRPNTAFATYFTWSEFKKYLPLGR